VCRLQQRSADREALGDVLDADGERGRDAQLRSCRRERRADGETLGDVVDRHGHQEQAGLLRGRGTAQIGVSGLGELRVAVRQLRVEQGGPAPSANPIIV
jgi:hypothetical protein